MKIFSLVVVFLLVPVLVGAEVIDTKDENITVSREIDTISIMPSKNFAVIQIKKTYLLEGVPVIGMKRIEFRDRMDDPETEGIDETDTSYTDLLYKSNEELVKIEESEFLDASTTEENAVDINYTELLNPITINIMKLKQLIKDKL